MAKKSNPSFSTTADCHKYYDDLLTKTVIYKEKACQAQETIAKRGCERYYDGRLNQYELLRSRCKPEP